MTTRALTIALAILALALVAQAKISRLDYDFIVVGAGTAGSTVASKIALRMPKKTVLLIEAGGYDSEVPVWDSTQALDFTFALPEFAFMDWAQQSTPQTGLLNRVLDLPRGKILGGCNSVNILAHVWGNRADWNNLSSLMSDPGWSWSALGLYRYLTEFFLGVWEIPTNVNGYSDLIASATENGFPLNAAGYNSGNQFGSSTLELLARAPAQPRNIVIRETTYDTFVRPHLNSPFSKIEVLANHLATRILTDGTRATGVEVLSVNRNRAFNLTANLEVIVSAGTYKSPQLLKLSGIGPAAELNNLGIPVVVDLPGVGQNLRDHMLVINAFATLISNPVVTLATVPTVITFGPEPTGQPSCEMFLAPESAVVSHLKPKSTGTVTLASTDPTINPLVDHAFLTHPDDLADLRDCERHVLDIYTSMQNRNAIFDSVILPLNATDQQIEAYIQASSSTWGHPVGTCKMGPASDPMSVVDTNLKVRGMQGLRVIDASIFPVLPSANTNSPTILVAKKGAKAIIDDY